MKRFAYRSSLQGLLVVASLSLVSGEASASEPKYQDLKAQGFSTSKMSRNAAGSIGWVVAKGSDRYFCRGFLGIESNANDLKNGNPRADQVGRCSKLK
jgi:hypothetical protein